MGIFSLLCELRNDSRKFKVLFITAESFGKNPDMILIFFPCSLVTEEHKIWSIVLVHMKVDISSFQRKAECS